MSVNIQVNGKETVFGGGSIWELVESYNIEPRKVVVEKNGLIVHRESYKEEDVREGDVIEIVTFVGGG